MPPAGADACTNPKSGRDKAKIRAQSPCFAPHADASCTRSELRKEAAMSRVWILLYGLLCYAVALGVFVYAFGFMGGFLTPAMLDGFPERPLTQALTIDFGLLLL